MIVGPHGKYMISFVKTDTPCSGVVALVSPPASSPWGVP